MEKKDKIVRIIVSILSLLAGASYFFKYIEFSAGIGNFQMGSSSLLNIDDYPNMLYNIFSESLLIVCIFCFIPILILLASIIANIIALFSKKEKTKRNANKITCISGIITFLSAISAVYLFIFVKEKIGFGLEVGIRPMPMWFVQIVVTICIIAIGFYWQKKFSITQRMHTPSPKDVAIVGLMGGISGQIFMLNNDERVSIGRDPQQCNIIVPGNSANVSRKHCVVHYDFDRETYLVQDASSNGTFIYENGQKKRLPYGVEISVPAGSVIMLGDELTSFRLN